MRHTWLEFAPDTVASLPTPVAARIMGCLRVRCPRSYLGTDLQPEAVSNRCPRLLPAAGGNCLWAMIYGPVPAKFSVRGCQSDDGPFATL